MASADLLREWINAKSRYSFPDVTKVWRNSKLFDKFRARNKKLGKKVLPVRLQKLWHNVWPVIEQHPEFIELKVKSHGEAKYHEKGSVGRENWIQDLKNKANHVVLVGGHSKSFRKMVKKYGKDKGGNTGGYDQHKLYNTEVVYVKMEFRGNVPKIAEVKSLYQPPEGPLRTGRD